jgi:hypothetical protein
MARSMFELPNDLLINIFATKADLEMTERPDLYMTHNYNTCYSCGNDSIIQICRYNGINYKFCDFCWYGPMTPDEDVESFIDYVNKWQLGDISRSEKMYRKACAPHTSEDTWNAFWNMCLNDEERTRPVGWMKQTYMRFEETVDRYADFPPGTPPGNEYIIDWGDSDSEVES